METCRNYLLTLSMTLVVMLTGCATWSGVNNTSKFKAQLDGEPPQAAATNTGLDEDEIKITLPSEQHRPIIRGQNFDDRYDRETAGSDDYFREPMPVSGGPASGDRFGGVTDPNVRPSQYYGQDSYDGGNTGDSGYAVGPPPVAQEAAPQQYNGPPAGQEYAPRQFDPPYQGQNQNSPYANQRYNAGSLPPPSGATIRPGDIGFGAGPTDSDITQPFTGRYADLEITAREQQTGRFMFGVGVNSDAGLTAQVVIDEYNFDWRRFPRSPDDLINGTAWRGGGQRLRIEAVPGSQLQRYMVNFTEPYLMDTPISLNLSGYLFDRRYFDWDEQRLGGRIGLGYRLTPDLSLSVGLRAENVEITDPRIQGIPELEEVLGDNSLLSGRVALTHDTRDSPFAPTEGHFMELTYEQTFGTFDYPRAIAEYRRYFLVNERIDGSGRHVLGGSLRAGFSGEKTPLFENFFAGGYSTIRGFRFRSANPKSGDIFVGGEFSLLGSVEYLFPITADDMLKGVVFCDYGTIEEEIQIEADDFRVTVGAGLRINVPAMGPAPIAIDLAVPIAREQTDRIQNFSFFVGFGR